MPTATATPTSTSPTSASCSGATAGRTSRTGIGSSGIRGATTTDRLINENTIEGAGDVGSNPMALTNRGLGLIDANDPTYRLRIDPSANGVVNSGTLQASWGASLALCDGNFADDGGLVRADHGTVMIFVASVASGNLDVVGAGELRLASSNGVTGS
ncbi:MAG TPA: hypothetical protein PKY77_26855 [Phycisphaerae bacterium]|nr:hypothetical protein [Phycisphaerae bacterium]